MLLPNPFVRFVYLFGLFCLIGLETAAATPISWTNNRIDLTAAYTNTLRNRVLNEAAITITVPTVGDARFSTCGGEKFITLSIQNSSGGTLTGVQAAIDLSGLPGFTFGGTLTSTSGGTVTVADPLIPTFNLPDIPSGGTVVFDVGIEVGCEANGLIAGGSNGGFSVEVTYAEGTGNSTASSGSLDIVKPSLSIPSMVGNGGSGATFDAYLGLTDSLIVTVANAGNGSLSSFTYYAVSDADLQLDAVRVGDSTLQVLGFSGDTTFFLVPTGVLKYATQNAGSPTNDDLLFQFNETLDFREIYTVLDCDSSPPDLIHGARYGCDGGAIPNCEESTANSGVRFGFSRPTLSTGVYDRYLPECFGDEGISTTYFLVNTGAAPASNIQIGFRYQNLGVANYDTTSTTYRIGQTSPEINVPAVQGYTTWPRGSDPGRYGYCEDPQTVRRFRIELPILLEPGDTVYIRTQHFANCQCGWRSGDDAGIACSFGHSSDAMAPNSTDPYNTYQDPCGTATYQINQVTGITAPLASMTTFPEGGKQINTGQTSSSTYTSDYFYSNFYSSSYLRDAYPDRTIEFKFVIGEGLDWTGTDGDLSTTDFEFVDRDGDLWSPDAVEYTDHDGGPDTLVLRYTGQNPGSFSRSAAALKKLTYVADCDETGPLCSQGGNTTIEDYALFYPNYGANCTNCPYTYLECPGTQSIQVNCPSCDPCEGLFVHESTTNRVSFGSPDNDSDRQPDGTGPADTIDLTKVALKRLISGDTVLTSVHASFHTSATHPEWENAILSLNFASQYTVVPVDGDITWFDSSANTTYTHDLLEQFPDGTRFVTNVSPDKLRDLGAVIPPDINYGQGDSIWVNLRYQIMATSLGSSIYEINLDENHHAAHDVYANSPTEYKCNNYDDRLNIVGIYDVPNNSLSSTFGGCSVSSYGVGSRAYNTWGSTGIDYFPNEYRIGPRRIVLAKLVKPSEFEWVDIRWRHIQKPVTTYIQSNTNIPLTDPNVTVQEDTLWFDVKNYIADQDNIRGDGGEYLYIYGRLQGTCQTAVGNYQSDADYTFYYEQDPLIYGSPTHEYNHGSNGGGITYNGGADLQVQFDVKSQPLYSETACFEITLLNPTNNLASYSFLNIMNPTGNVVIKSLTETTSGSTLLTPTLGIYQLGDTNGSSSGTTRNFELCVSSNNCNTDSLYVVAGWDCGGYPTTVEEATCAIPDTLYLTTVDAELDMEVTSPDVDVAVNMCDDTTYVVKLSSSLLGRLHDINLEMAMPVGADYVPGTFQVAYPPPFSGDFEDATWINAADPTLLYGGTYHINVSEQDTYLDEDGMPGTTEIGQNFAFIRFDTETSCGYTSGARVGFTSWGYNSCGELTNYRYSPSDPVITTGASTNLKSFITLNNVTLNGCGADSATLNVNYGISTGSDPSNRGDSIMIVLPPGTYYLPGTQVAGANASSGDPFIETRDGVQTLFWKLPNGMVTGDAGDFTFQIAAADAGQACLNAPIAANVISTEPISCPGGPAGCTVRIISSSGGSQLSIEKPTYTLAFIEADAVAEPTDSVLLNYALEVNNTGTALRPDDSLIVRLFGDEGDGDYGPGDTDLGELRFDVAIASNTIDTLYGSHKVLAGTTCNLMAVIDRTRTCACENSTSPRRQATLDMDFQTDFETCSDTPLPNIGPAPLNNVSYEWIGLAGVSTAKLSSTNTTPVTFEHKNTNGANVTFQYALRAVQGGECFAYDTVNIEIKAETYDSVTMVRCSDADFYLVGPAGSNYSWEPAAQVDTADIQSPFVAGGVSVPTLFAVDYTDPEGCPARQVSMVNLTNCAGTAIGDTVWFDNNNNGQQDLGEPPVVGAKVNLFTNGNTAVPFAITYTDANGYYLFDNIPAGNYRVGFEPTPGTRPTTYKAAGIPEEDNSDMDTLTYLTEAVYVPNGATNTTLDAGYLQCVITVNEAYTECSNNGTSPDASDDFFQVHITATSIYGGTSDRFVVEQNGVVLNPLGTPYGKQARVNANGAFAADGVSTYTLIVRDMSYSGGCQEIIITPPTPGCSDCPVRFCLPVETSRPAN